MKTAISWEEARGLMSFLTEILAGQGISVTGSVFLGHREGIRGDDGVYLNISSRNQNREKMLGDFILHSVKKRLEEMGFQANGSPFSLLRKGEKRKLEVRILSSSHLLSEGVPYGVWVSFQDLEGKSP